MPNNVLAQEWLEIADKNLATAVLLNREKHFTDVIAIDIQQSIEKTLKALYAFNNEKIPRTHSLDILFNYACSKIQFDKEITIKDIIMISDYYESERYPGPKYFIPSRSEINHTLSIAQIINKNVKDYILGSGMDKL